MKARFLIGLLAGVVSFGISCESMSTEIENEIEKMNPVQIEKFIKSLKATPETCYRNTNSALIHTLATMESEKKISWDKYKELSSIQTNWVVECTSKKLFKWKPNNQRRPSGLR